MGYAKTADLHVARSADTIAALAARGTFLVRGVDTSDATESATKGTDWGSDMAAVIAEVVATTQPLATVLTNTTASFTTADESKLDAIEAGATADQSAAEILAALVTVDGTGTGLDADLLDGQHATAFATAAQGATADTATQPGDLGTLAAQNDIAVPADITATGTPSASTFLRGDGTWAAPAGGGGGDMLAANNLSDLASAATARTNLGLGTAATTAATAYATAAQGATADTALQSVAVPADITATGTPSSTTFLRGDGTWSVPVGGSGPAVSSGAGAPVSTPAALGDIYIDTTADVAYHATGIAAATDWQQAVAVATSTAGTWEARPQAQIVVWAAGTDTAAATPAAAVGDDIVILAEDADLTTIAAANNGAILAATTASFLAADETKLDGIEAGATADQTAAEILAALLTVDGAGSGLDADLLDGQSSAAFATAAQGTLADTSVQPGDTIPIADGGTGATTVQGAIAALRVAPVTIAATTDTLAAGDDGAENLYTAAGLVTVTLANIATGFECVLVSLGAGGLTVAAGGMTFANSFTPSLTIAQGEALYIKQTAASTFIVLGGTAA